MDRFSSGWTAISKGLSGNAQDIVENYIRPLKSRLVILWDILYSYSVKIFNHFCFYEIRASYNSECLSYTQTHKMNISAASLIVFASLWAHIYGACSRINRKQYCVASFNALSFDMHISWLISYASQDFITL